MIARLMPQPEKKIQPCFNHLKRKVILSIANNYVFNKHRTRIHKIILFICLYQSNICKYVKHLIFKDGMVESSTGILDLEDLISFKISVSLQWRFNIIKNMKQVNLFLEFIMKK